MLPIIQLRALYHRYKNDSLQSIYWDYAQHQELLKKLTDARHAAFARHVETETAHLQHVLAEPQKCRDEERLQAAVDWILRAQQATPDDGVSLGYFPLNVDGGWKASYPETTGYLITSLLRFAVNSDSTTVREAAFAMADWEIDVQMPSGAVQGGPLVPPEKQTPAAFNTGMVLDGWCSAYEATGETRYLDAGSRAAKFLANDMDTDGYFRTNGEFVNQGEIKTYTCLCAWSMLRIARLLKDDQIECAAVRAVEGALRRQQPIGWFGNNCLTFSSAPLTHTIGYTLQGVLEVGALMSREDFLGAVQLALGAVLPQSHRNGFLSGRFDNRWRPAAPWVCLTGSCQLAVVAYRFAEVTGKHDFVPFADRLLDFAKATQRLHGEDQNMVGAIAGSFPILGGYMTAGYPNWATKYFIDAMMLRGQLSDGS